MREVGREAGQRDKRAVAAMALAVGLLLRLFFVWRFPRTAGDPLVYMDYARTLLEHGVYGYTRNVGGVVRSVPSLVRLPGYPLFLAACFAVFGHANTLAVLVVQALVDLGSCVLAACTAARLFSARAGWWTLWLAVLCPFTATYVAAPLTETPVLFTVALAFYVLLRWRESAGRGWLVVLAGAVGYSILLRPDQGLLLVAVVPAVAWMTAARGWHRMRPAVLLAVLALLPLLPWTVRNWHTMHVFQPLAPRSASDPGELVPEGFNRWYRTWGVEYATNETAYWNYNSDDIDPEALPARAFDSPAQRETTDELLEEYNRTTTETPAFDSRFAALAAERVRGHWLRYYVVLPGGRVVDMLFRPRTELLPVHDDWWKPHRHGEAATVTAALLYGGLNLILYGLAVLGWMRRRQLLRQLAAEPVLWAMLASIVLRLALLATLDNAEPRYTLEFFPVVLVLAGGWLGGIPTHRDRTAANGARLVATRSRHTHPSP